MLAESFVKDILKEINIEKGNGTNLNSDLMLDFINFQNISNVLEILNIDAESILNYCEIHSLNKSSKETIFITLNSIYKYLNDNEIISNNKHFKGYRQYQNKPNIGQRKSSIKLRKGNYDNSIVSELININQKYEYDEKYSEIIRKRNEILIKFIYMFSLQSLELIELKWNSIRKDNQNIYYLRIVNGRGKSEVDFCEVPELLFDELLLYRKIYLKYNKLLKNKYIFPSLSNRTFGNMMTGKGVNDVIRNLSFVVNKKISPIILRNISSQDYISHNKINEILFPVYRKKYYFCKSCNKVMNWNDGLICDDCKKQKKSKSHFGYLYFIKTENHDFFKIGITNKNLINRLSTNQVGNMYELYIFGYIYSPLFKEYENEFHNKLQEYHMRGEWFNINEDILMKYIQLLDKDNEFILENEEKLLS